MPHQAPFFSSALGLLLLPLLAHAQNVTVTAMAGLARTNGFKSSSCNPSNGQWVRDYSRPGYDISQCPLIWTVARSTNCMRWKNNTSWTKYSWMPKSCGPSPRFNPAKFLSKMSNKVIALVGDSIMSSAFFPSFLCQIASFTPVKADPVLTAKYGVTAWVAQAYGTVIVNYWSPFLCATSTNPWYLQRLKDKTPAQGDTAVNVFKPDMFWAKNLYSYDIVLFETAAHWPHAVTWDRRFFVNHRWQLIQPQPGTLTAFAQGMMTILKYFKPNKKIRVPRAYVLSPSPRLAQCQYSSNIATDSDVAYLKARNSQARAWFPLQESIVKGSAARWVDITFMSLYRSDAMVAAGNPKTKDCLHPCVPGLPDSWVDVFYLNWLQDTRFN